MHTRSSITSEHSSRKAKQTAREKRKLTGAIPIFSLNEGRTGYAKRARATRKSAPIEARIAETATAAPAITAAITTTVTATSITPKTRAAAKTTSKTKATKAAKRPKVVSTPKAATSINSSSDATEGIDIAEARKRSANDVYAALMEKEDPSTTLQHYKTYMKLWKTYCDEVHDGDCIVNASKMLGFFESVVFKRTVKKYIDPNAVFSGVVGMAVVKATGKAARQQQRYPGEWKSVDLQEEDLLASVLGDMEMSEQDEHGHDQDEQDQDDDEVDDDCVSPESDDESVGVDATHRSVAEDEGAQIGESLGSFMISSVADKNKVILEAETDDDDRKFIRVPVSYETVDSARKSLIYLWRHQQQRTAAYPNPAPNPRHDAVLRDAIDQYEVALVYDQSYIGSTRSDSCSIRDPYTEKEFIRMITHTWCQRPMRQLKGKRFYQAPGRFRHIREHFCLLARHHMLLRDEDARNLNLSDIFSIQTRHSATGSAIATGLTFCLSRGKTNRKGVKLYATAFRHKKYYRCTVGAFAYYMLERFMVEKEPIPDFSNPDSWYNIKLLVAGGDPNKRVKNRTTALNSKTQIDSTAAVMRTCEVYSSKVTHSGRHAGTSEAYRLNLSLDHIRHLGRWVMGQMESFYAPKNPIIGAFYMAHFNKPDQPFLIERDLVMPPLELQRLIFPWIEHSFDLDDPGKTSSWILECDQEMLGMDETVVTEDDIHWEGRFQHSTAQETPDWTANRLTSSAQVDRIAFLKLLVRMRRVILQDAVLYLAPDSKGRTLRNSLFTSLPHIFDSPMFTTFKNELLQAMELHRQNSTVISPSVLVDKRDVSNALNTLSNQVSQVQVAFTQKQGTMTEHSERIDKLVKAVEELVQKTPSGLLSASNIPCLHPPCLHTLSPHPPYPYSSCSHPPCFHPSYPHCSSYPHPSHPHCSSYLHSSYPPPPYLPTYYPHPSHPHQSYPHQPHPHPLHPHSPYQRHPPPNCAPHTSRHFRPTSSQPARQPWRIQQEAQHHQSSRAQTHLSAQAPVQIVTCEPTQGPSLEPPSLSAQTADQELTLPPAPSYHNQHEPYSLAAAYRPQDLPPLNLEYKMLPDRGSLTVRAAWDEYHGPLSRLKSKGQFLKDSSMKRAYSRRGEFVSIIQEAAEAEGRLPEDLVDEWTEKFRGRTINSIREALKSKHAKEVMAEKQILEPVETSIEDTS